MVTARHRASIGAIVIIDSRTTTRRAARLARWRIAKRCYGETSAAVALIDMRSVAGAGGGIKDNRMAAWRTRRKHRLGIMFPLVALR